MINSSIFKELAYGKASDTFHNWADAVHMYGLNFASLEDANAFEASVAQCIEKLKAQSPGTCIRALTVKSA